MSELVGPSLYTSLLGSSVGLFGTLIGLWVSWRKDFNQETRRFRLLDEASRELAVLDAYLKVQALCLTEDDLRIIKTRVSERAERAYAQVDATRIPVEKLPVREVPKSILRRTLLLYTPNRIVTWFPRVCYWVSVLWFLLLMIIPFPAGGLGAIIFGLPPTLLFYGLDRLVDTPTTTERIANSPEPP